MSAENGPPPLSGDRSVVTAAPADPHPDLLARDELWRDRVRRMIVALDDYRMAINAPSHRYAERARAAAVEGARHRLRLIEQEMGL